MGCQDAFVLNPNEEVKALVRSGDFLGKSMLHCHNTVHDKHATTLRFDILQ